LAGQSLGEVDRPADVPADRPQLPHLDVGNGSSDHVLGEPAAYRLDLG
jgi:hypothetical protein